MAYCILKTRSVADHGRISTCLCRHIFLRKPVASVLLVGRAGARRRRGAAARRPGGTEQPGIARRGPIAIGCSGEPTCDCCLRRASPLGCTHARCNLRAQPRETTDLTPFFLPAVPRLAWRTQLITPFFRSSAGRARLPPTSALRPQQPNSGAHHRRPRRARHPPPSARRHRPPVSGRV